MSVELPSYLRGSARTLKATVTDRTGALIDLDSYAAKIYKPDNTLYTTINQINIFRVSKGLYKFDISIPADAVDGRWKCVLEGSKDGFDYSNQFGFKVILFNFPTIHEVRDFLSGLPIERVKDETIKTQINIAYNKVKQNASDEVTEDEKEEAALLWAAYLTYLAYATEVERSTGRVPQPVIAHLAELKQLADQAIVDIKSGGVQTKPPVLGVTETISQRYRTLRYASEG